jgi:hypothetical protein
MIHRNYTRILQRSNKNITTSFSLVNSFRNAAGSIPARGPTVAVTISIADVGAAIHNYPSQ